MLDPGAGRIEKTLPPNLSISCMIAETLPNLTEAQKPRLRVVLVGDAGESVVPAVWWPHIKPKDGTRVVMRMVPAGDNLRSILLAVVSVAAIAAGQIWAAPLALATGLSTGVSSALITAGVTLAGTLLVNAFVPGAQPGSGATKDKPVFAASGWRNRYDPGGVIPQVLGGVRMAPPYAAPPYSVVVGDQVYLRTLFCWGYGPLQISLLRIGETAIEQFEDVFIETREGYDTDEKVTLYPKQVIEEPLAVELRRDIPRDDMGEPTGDPGEESPVIRVSADDVDKVGLIFSFPAGLVEFDEEEGDAHELVVSVRVRYRKAGTVIWTTVETIEFQNSTTEAFYRQYEVTFPERARYEVEVTRMTDERTDHNVQDRVVLAMFQSMRPEYPLNVAEPLALTAVLVRSTFQLNGTLDSLNGLVSTVAKSVDLDGTWDTVAEPTNQCAALFRHVLQGSANFAPVPDSAIDLANLADWAERCGLHFPSETTDLTYNRLHDFAQSLWDTLCDVARAGRAIPRFDGVQWGVVMDRPQDTVVAHLNARNSRNWSWSSAKFIAPDGFRATYPEEADDFREAEVTVEWPGHTGDLDVLEDIPVPGMTRHDQVFQYLRRRQYELIHRNATYQCDQDAQILSITRGDLVRASVDIVEKTQAAFHVVAQHGRRLKVDGDVPADTGGNYSISWRKHSTRETFVEPVTVASGDPSVLYLQSDTVLPIDPDGLGPLVHFGPSANLDLELIVKGIEAGDGKTSHITLVPHAPEIDELLAADAIPSFNNRFGDAFEPDLTEPDPPDIYRVTTHYSTFLIFTNPDGFTVLVRPAPSAILIGSFKVRHRLSGSPTWVETAEFSIAASGTLVTGYSKSNVVEIAAMGTSIDGIDSAWSDTVTFTIGGVFAMPKADTLKITADSTLITADAA